MKYNGLDIIFSDWKETCNIETNVYALSINKKETESLALCLKGSINKETAEAYTNKVSLFKSFESKEFSLSGHKNKEYGIGDLELIREEWENLKKLVDEANTIDGCKKKTITDKIGLTITKVVLSSKEYYFVATQESSEKMYKKKKIFSVGEVLKTMRPNEFFTMTNDFDCIIDEEQGCFYSLKNSQVIQLFNLKEKIKGIVKSLENNIDEWDFIENVDLIKCSINQQNIYEPLFKIFKDKEYVDSLKIMTAVEFKERLIRVANGKITENDFQDNKLIINKANRALFLELLARKKKYNIVTDSIEV